MVSTPRKRYASRSPDGGRYAKRPATSSPEEGEVDDTMVAPANPSILPISLPQKPTILAQKKVPFPFKKKPELGKNGEVSDSQESPLNVFDKFEEDAKKARLGEEPRRQRPRPVGKSDSTDHWAPPSGQPQSLLSRLGPPTTQSRYPPGRDNRDRDRRRSPSSWHSPRRSQSPHSPYYRDKHRLPAPRSPGSFSPLSSDKNRDRSRERGYDRDNKDRDRDRHGGWGNDYRRYPDSARHYRPQNGQRRPDDRDWTRRDGLDRRSSNRGDERGYDHDRRPEPSRWPPSPPGPSGPVSPPPPPPNLAPLDKPESPLPPSAPPPPPDADTVPRPPSSSPPPAPPPDSRLSKDALLPPTHAQVKITIKPPDAPPSPRPLPIPSAFVSQSLPRGPEVKVQPPKDESLEVPKPRFKRKLPTRRTQKEEAAAYGHAFVGCGLQSDYEATTKLGEGTFGEVHKAIHKATGTVVALKRILMHNEKEGMPVTALREIKILKALKHYCIVNILDMFIVRSTEKDPLSVYMVFPYMDHDLAGLLENERVKLQPSHIKLYMKQLLEGTEYMHRNHILHRDMKAANLLISNDGSLKIADFGLARTFDIGVANGRGDGTQRGRERKYTNCVVTRWYRPPELLLGARHYGGEVDMWGIGCVLGEMFTRRPILPGTSDLDQLEKIWVLCGAPNQHNWPYFDQLPGCDGVIRFNSQPRRLKHTYDSIGEETVDLLDKLLVINPRDRITAAQALEHDYFWTDPLPADPKTMPSYEASHEFDKRGHRNHHPMPLLPPAQHHGNQTRHQQPPGNQPYNNNRGGGGGDRGGGQRGGPQPPHGYGGDMNRRGPGPPSQYPPPPHAQPGFPNSAHPSSHPGQYRGGPGPSQPHHGQPPLHHGPLPHGMPPGPPHSYNGPPHHGPSQRGGPFHPHPVNGPHGHGPPFHHGQPPPPQMPGLYSTNAYGGPPPPNNHNHSQYPNLPRHPMPGRGGGQQGPRYDRRDAPPRDNYSGGGGGGYGNGNGTRLAPNANLPPKPTAPLGFGGRERENDRPGDRSRDRGPGGPPPTDWRGGSPGDPGDGPAGGGGGGGLNYG